MCSLAVKLLGVAYMNRNLGWNLNAPDTRGVYEPLARSLAEGHGYRLNGDEQNATRVAPVFPLYLAGVYRVFGADAPVWIFGALNAIMRAVVTCLIYVLALRAFGAKPALWAGAVHALDPWEGFWAAFVLKESLAVLLLIAAIALVALALERESWVVSAIAGATLAIAAMTRYATLGLFVWTLALIAALSIGRTIGAKSALRLAVAFALGLVAALAPWLARNNRVVGAPIVNTQAGYYFFVSNGPGAERTFETWGYSGLSSVDASAAAAVAAAHQGPLDRDAAFLREGVVHLVSHPSAAARIVAARFVNMWRPTFAGASWANISILGGSYCAFTVAAIAGLTIGRRRAIAGGERTALVLYSTVAFYVVLHAAFWSEIRYRQYVTPLLAIFAGLAIDLLVAMCENNDAQ